jgi:Mg2+-importing ATPase
VLDLAWLNSHFQAGLRNPLDTAIVESGPVRGAGWAKIDEVPFDFQRRRVSVLVEHEGRRLLITKGAPEDVIKLAGQYEEPGKPELLPLDDAARTGAAKVFEGLSAEGFRALGVAWREIGEGVSVTKDDEAGMVFAGVLVLFDPPKAGVGDTLAQLKRLGVGVKMITGDNRLVAAHASAQVGLSNPGLLSGTDLRHMSDDALLGRVNGVDIFAEIEPNQKERIILALRKAGNVVGYMGDGINDASALHAADVGISVESAVDVAKEAADIVLLERDLGVLVQGVQEGRTTFANTLKYVFMATSANFGNMFSMAGVSLFLPFLPLLPKQVLLTNLMTDFPEMTIATDTVDAEMVEQPRRWDTRFIRNFMMTFGLVSSVFDYATFGVLHLLGATPQQFRTGWFLESVVSASLIVLVVRTRRPFFLSRPSRPLAVATGVVVGITLALPHTPLAAVFGFVPLGLEYLGPLAAVVALYILTAELVKRRFYRL